MIKYVQSPRENKYVELNQTSWGCSCSFFLTIRAAFLQHGGVAATAAFIKGIYGEWKTIANESLLPVGLELQTMQQHLCWRAEETLPQSHGTGGGGEAAASPVLCFQTPPFIPTPTLLHPSPSSLHSFPPLACRSRSQACWGDSQVKSIKHLPPRSLLKLETWIPEKKHLNHQEFWVSTARKEGWPTPRGRM